MNSQQATFDLNINNYDFEELISFFKLPYSYTLNDLLLMKKHITNVINDTNSYNKEKKIEIINFINKAKDRLLLKLQNEMVQ